MMRIFILFLLFLAASPVAWSQCSNSIKLKNAVYSSAEKNGKIELAVSAKGSFTCTLNIEKGSGPIKTASQAGTGSTIISFEKLDPNQIYQVVVEFASEENKFCKRLQKSQITLESK